MFDRRITIGVGTPQRDPIATVRKTRPAFTFLMKPVEALGEFSVATFGSESKRVREFDGTSLEREATSRSATKVEARRADDHPRRRAVCRPLTCSSTMSSDELSKPDKANKKKDKGHECAG
jgi:hypothetical protein